MIIKSPIPGKIIWVAKLGDAICPSSVVAVIDAMKMENMITAGTSGRIVSVKVKVNDNIEEGQALVEVY